MLQVCIPFSQGMEHCRHGRAGPGSSCSLPVLQSLGTASLLERAALHSQPRRGDTLPTPQMRNCEIEHLNNGPKATMGGVKEVTGHLRSLLPHKVGVCHVSPPLCGLGRWSLTATANTTGGSHSPIAAPWLEQTQSLPKKAHFQI